MGETGLVIGLIRGCWWVDDMVCNTVGLASWGNARCYARGVIWARDVTRVSERVCRCPSMSNYLALALGPFVSISLGCDRLYSCVVK